MTNEIEERLNEGLDYILNQLSHGNTIEGLKRGSFWMGFEQLKEWKLKFGYQFQVYSNDHLIDNKPHFHIVNQSEKIDCRFFLTVKLYTVKEKAS